MRRAARVDDNQADIVEALVRAGIWVQSTAALGNGFPDLITCHRRVFRLLEVKDGRRPPSGRRLTPLEERFFAACPGPVHLVTDPIEALRVHGVEVSL